MRTSATFSSYTQSSDFASRPMHRRTVNDKTISSFLNKRSCHGWLRNGEREKTHNCTLMYMYMGTRNPWTTDSLTML